MLLRTRKEKVTDEEFVNIGKWVKTVKNVLNDQQEKKKDGSTIQVGNKKESNTAETQEKAVDNELQIISEPKRMWTK